MVTRNPTLQLPDSAVPHLGTNLGVRWRFFGGLLAAIIIVDTLVVILGFIAIRFVPAGKGRGKHG